MEKYKGYATRSENTRNPERMSHGKVARKRYKRVDHCAQVEALGQGRITGIQKRKPATKNDACSRACQASECIPSVNNAGTCHPKSVNAEAVQHNAGRESLCANRCTNGSRKRGPSTAFANRGNPCQKANRGSPSKIKAGANVISSRCWIMWTVNKS